MYMNNDVHRALQRKKEEKDQKKDKLPAHVYNSL